MALERVFLDFLLWIERDVHVDTVPPWTGIQNHEERNWEPESPQWFHTWWSVTTQATFQLMQSHLAHLINVSVHLLIYSFNFYCSFIQRFNFPFFHMLHLHLILSDGINWNHWHELIASSLKQTLSSTARGQQVHSPLTWTEFEGDRLLDGQVWE